MGTDLIKTLGRAIHRRFGSEPVYVEAVPVHETFEGQTVWDGIVHVFDVPGYKDGTRCYAWAYLDDNWGGKQHIITVLHQPPVDSPRAAVQAAIVEQHHLREG
jgi:hypothetical protein